MEMINHCLPIRVAAMHFCYGNKKSAVDLVLPTMKALMGPVLRQRFCEHIGCGPIIVGSLAGFGIHQVHETLGGTLKFDNTWIQNCIEEEQRRRSTNQLQYCPSSPSSKKSTAQTTNAAVSSDTPPCNIKDGKRRSQWNRAA
jgi:hypothetical protein